MLDAAGGQRVALERFEPAAIADVLARIVAAEAVAMVYPWVTIGEGMATTIAEGRMRDADDGQGATDPIR